MVDGPFGKDNVLVDVYDLDGKYLGRGTVVHCNDPSLVPEEYRGMMFEHWGTPRITMPDGKVIYGVECWWSEVKDTPKPTPKQIKFVAPFIAEPATDNDKETSGGSK